MYTTQSSHEGERESRARHASSLECMQLWQCLSLCDAGSAHYCSYGSVFRGTPLLLLQVVLMNQVTTKVLDNNRGSKLVPALGEHALLYLIIAAQELLLFMHVIAHCQLTGCGFCVSVGCFAGDSWAHAATSRVILYWQEQTRHAFLYKSPWLPAKTAEYHVTADGIRGRGPQKRPRA